MAKIACVIGNKGGTGKTTISHMLCHGFGLLGRHSISGLTDTHRACVTKDRRNYLPFDARSLEALDLAVKKLSLAGDWIGVFDGGGNRPDIDERLAEVSGVVLLPFRDSHEDIRTVMNDLERFPNAFALPSQWPTNNWELASANRMVENMMKPYHDRVLEPVFRISASKLLLQEELPDYLPTTLNNACRQLALQLLMLLDLGLDNRVWKPLNSILARQTKVASVVM